MNYLELFALLLRMLPEEVKHGFPPYLMQSDSSFLLFSFCYILHLNGS